MKKFPVVMEAMTKLPDYYVHVACPVKSSTWLPQKRDRLIIIGSRRNFAWREPSSQHAVTLAEILEPGAQGGGTFPPKPEIIVAMRFNARIFRWLLIAWKYLNCTVGLMVLVFPPRGPPEKPTEAEIILPPVGFISLLTVL